MALLVTGSSGFLGSRLVDYLKIKSYSFTTISRSSACPNEFIFPSSFNYLAEKNTLLHLASPDAAICTESPVKSLSYSSASISYLLSNFPKFNINRIVLFSSIHVNNFFPSVAPASDPLYFYKFSKCLSESTLLSTSSPIKSLILRIPNIIGYSLSARRASLVPYLIAQQLLDNGHVNLRDSLETQRPFLPFNLFLKRLLELLCDESLPSSEIINIQPPSKTSLGELVTSCETALSDFYSCTSPSIYNFDSHTTFDQEIYREFYNIVFCLLQNS